MLHIPIIAPKGVQFSIVRPTKACFGWKISTFVYESTTSTHSTCNIPCRYTTAGVFGKCHMDRADHTACCRDPVVYTRVANLANWIRDKAPGARSNPGCPKKRVRRKIDTAFSSTCNRQHSSFQMLKRQNYKSQSKYNIKHSVTSLKSLKLRKLLD